MLQDLSNWLAHGERPWLDGMIQLSQARCGPRPCGCKQRLAARGYESLASFDCFVSRHICMSSADASLFSSAVLDRCESDLAGWVASLRTPAPVVITAFATALPPQWLLGASAAFHGIPLVLMDGTAMGRDGPCGGPKILRRSPSSADPAPATPTAAMLVVDAWDDGVNGISA